MSAMWWREPQWFAGEGSDSARVVHAVAPGDFDALAARLGVAAWLTQSGFRPKPGALALLPGDGGVGAALLVVAPADASDDKSPDASPGALYGDLARTLPEGDWRVEIAGGAAVDPVALAQGWGCGAYHYDRFVAPDRPAARLVTTPQMAPGIAAARAVWLARDLINTPANLLGPPELAAALVEVAEAFGAQSELVTAQALTDAYPTIAAVGAGSDRAPAVAVLRWAPAGMDAASLPLVSLVGKGVVFDTGGYDIKPSAAMLRMKKDMGGAAIMLAAAALLMARGAPCRLELRLGCVENSVSGHAMRPSDVIVTRRGLSVEVGNTDAEGRLVLCDLLAEASDLRPDWLIDAATLTGAARVALGPDLPALFGTDDALAEALLAAGRRGGDPLWRMPLWAGYAPWLSSRVADLNNVSARPMAGAITAALYLARFVADGVRWAHIDTYAWSDATRPGHPEGGDAQGAIAIGTGILQLLNAPASLPAV